MAYLQTYVTLITFCTILLNATQCCRTVLINSVLQHFGVSRTFEIHEAILHEPEDLKQEVVSGIKVH